MKTIFVGIGGVDLSDNPDEMLKTMALGSCVAVIIRDPFSNLTGMVHVALPEASINLDKAQKLPGFFADTGITLLMNLLKKKGLKTVVPRLIVKIAGGSQVMDSSNNFNIGKRNILAVKKMLWKFGMAPKAEDTGGDISRTVSIICGTNDLLINVPGRDLYKI